MRHAGEITSLLTAIFWTCTALAFEASSRKLGSMVVNLFKLVIGFFFLSVFSLFYRGYLLPTDATGSNWAILSVSGLFGFVLGDLCLMEAFVLIGARVSMLMMALSPLLTALVGWIVLGEVMSGKSWLGMVLTMTGVALVVLSRGDGTKNGGFFGFLKLSYPIWGLFLGFGGAFGQAVGLVLSKYGMRGYDPFASSQIRVLAGMAGFSVLFFFFRQWGAAGKALSQKKAMFQVTFGSFFGPFLGVSFSLLSLQLTSAGIASTIMAIVPVLIIPPSIIINKEKVTFKEIAGAVLAVGGVALFFV
jgi:drug/metabolite transporter (DMT)-like permease